MVDDEEKQRVDGPRRLLGVQLRLGQLVVPLVSLLAASIGNASDDVVQEVVGGALRMCRQHSVLALHRGDREPRRVVRHARLERARGLELGDTLAHLGAMLALHDGVECTEHSPP